MPMSEAPENNERENPPVKRRSGRSRRRSWIRRWSDSRLFVAFWRLWYRIYDWWYPPSDDHAGRHYGYGHSRKSRPVRAVQRLRRWLKYSAVGRGYRTLSAKWWNWWYPSSHHDGDSYGYGHTPKSRPVRAWRNFQRWIKHSAVGRACRKVYARWLNWWYPMPVDHGGSYYGHGNTPSNRVDLLLDRIGDWLEDSAVGRAYRSVSRSEEH